MVYDLAKAYQESDDKANFTPERTVHKKRSDAVRTPEFVDVVDEAIQEDPTKSMRKIAVEMHASRRTIQRTVKDDLNYTSYVFAHRHLKIKRKGEC